MAILLVAIETGKTPKNVQHVTINPL